jgi:hypothetical protein
MMPPYQSGSPTSKAAAASMIGLVTSLRQQVYDLILRGGPQGATRDEIEINLNMRAQTVSPRLRELELSGCIADSGHVRMQSSGRDGIVWIVVGPYVDASPRNARKPGRARIHKALYDIANGHGNTPEVIDLCTWIWDRFVVAEGR